MLGTQFVGEYQNKVDNFSKSLLSPYQSICQNITQFLFSGENKAQHFTDPNLPNAWVLIIFFSH